MSDTQIIEVAPQGADPVLFKQLVQAREILDNILAGMSVQDACELADVAYTTYRAWVRKGVFVPLLAPQIVEMSQAVEISVLKNWATIIEGIVDDAAGRSGSEDNPVYARDRHSAAQKLYDWIIKPAMERTPEPSGEEDAYLTALENAQPSWMPRLGNVKSVTIEFEDDDGVIEVTPLGEEMEVKPVDMP